ncbi:hypothetical protein SODALDRAFT_331010 [Sodiomyces alkalinus F11]|uniref:Uncharacterized protein n=1 Tax=Sodiomyces alkalinus (strain CBS 110278 / VKM F-3762 / F11) TaxID=1314773 RepID=A0A3N2Q3E7_SODAK|nr:hypothetical protein SODALDRAFT_331010 [Sodiomyces alkalinus F11]ROT41289.1 hypothetical protein SODALDRAFT_331010 [Sodiomyces alkalinus F11]
MSGSKTIRYSTHRDWELWQRDYRLTAMTNNVWRYLRPDNPDEPPAETPMPASNAYAMDADGRAAYHIDLMAWEIRERICEKYARGIAAVHRWQEESIAQKKWKALLVGTTPQEVYEAVRTDAAGCRKTDAVNSYQQHLRKPPNKPKKVMDWINEWSLLINECHDVGVLTDPVVWCNDFYHCLLPLTGHWVDALRRLIDLKTVTPGDLAMEGKRYAEERINLPTIARHRTAAVPALALASGETGKQESSSSQAPAAERRNHRRSRGRGGRDARKNLAPNPNSDGKQPKQPANRNPSKRKQSDYSCDEPCRACARPWHNLENCWYIFPEQAMSGWTPETASNIMVERMIHLAPEFKAAVEEVKARKKVKGGNSPMIRMANAEIDMWNTRVKIEDAT